MTQENNPPEDETFISRWSRRKQQVALEEEQDDALENIISTSEESQDINELAELESPEEPTEQERLDTLNELTDEDMPELESLDEGSNYAGFMSENVSEALRKMALRKLFAGDSYNVRDGLDEYDGDYTSFEKLDPSTITADMKHMIEVELRRKKEKEEKEAQEARDLEEQQEREQQDELLIEDTPENDDKETASEDLTEEEGAEDNLISNEEPVNRPPQPEHIHKEKKETL